MIAIDARQLVLLLQLASPALPVGAYSYSQGLEAAAEDGTVSDEHSAEVWIRDVLEFSVASFEVPLLWRMLCALKADDLGAFRRWDSLFLAGRETAELRAETLQMGQALVLLMRNMPAFGAPPPELLCAGCVITFPAAYSLAVHELAIDSAAALIAYMWSWLENQVIAAVKAIPLGQSAGQRMLAAIGSRLPQLADQAMCLEDDELSNFAPGLAIASSRHETQYSRLFRS